MNLKKCDDGIPTFEQFIEHLYRFEVKTALSFEAWKAKCDRALRELYSCFLKDMGEAAN
jgi:hypothetical protein